MTRVASIDGAIVAPEAARVSAYDRGFLYGDGVFDTLRVYAGRPFALDEHLARLARSAAMLKIDPGVDAATLAREVQAAIAASDETDASVRITITRGAMAGGPSLAVRAPLRATRVIFVEPLHLDRAAYVDGLRAVTLGWPRFAEHPATSQAKMLPYVTSWLALDEARGRGADDAIFIEGPFVREATTANVFAVRDDGVLATPPEGPGVLAGITRSHVIDLALTLGQSIAITSLAITELARAREVFLTSSVREIVPVVAIDGAPVGDGAPGATTRLIHRALRVRAGARGPCPWE